MHTAHRLLVSCVLLLVASGCARPRANLPSPDTQPVADETEADPAKPDPLSLEAPPAEKPGNWFIDFGVTQAHPLLHDTQRQIDASINRPIRLLGIDDSTVRTFQDWRRNGLLLSPIVGAGYAFDEYWSVGGRVGASMGTQHNDRQLITGPLRANFKYSVEFLELYAALYPFKRPDPAQSVDWISALRGGRPVLRQTFSVTNFVQEATVRVPLGLVAVRSHILNDDVIAGYHPGLGWEWALSNHWSAQILGSYNFYFDRSNEFNGVAASLTFAYRF